MTTTHSTKASSKTLPPDSPVQDVSDAEPAEVVDEMTRRSTAVVTGGGAFPDELLLKNYVGNEQSNRYVPPTAEPLSDEGKS